jgi:alkaline phosphatase D
VKLIVPPTLRFIGIAVAIFSSIQLFGAATPLFPQSVASGDPTPTTVVLWTRVEANLSTNAPDPVVSVTVATDPGFTNVVSTRTNLVARRAHDFCVKTPVTGLQPHTRYYYRFSYNGTYSATGRTITAPAPGDLTPVRFVYVSCQDYIGKYYNVWADVANREVDNLDFVLHLGDYIYETVNDASFQNVAPVRQIQFRDLVGAKNLGDTNTPVYAASSLDNYRQLYETYHSDPALIAIHESVPMINIWDDHEFDPVRRRHAEQAFFEFIPNAFGMDAQGVSVDDSMLYPNAKIYRTLGFGSLMDLFLTDYRSYRPDHLVPEDAFPGAVVMPENVVSNFFGAAWTAVRTGFDPYINIDDPKWASLKPTLVAGARLLYLGAGDSAADATARAVQVVTGNLSVTVINLGLKQFGLPTPLTPAVISTLPRGLSYAYLGKQSVFGELGSRYLLVRPTFELYAGWKSLLNPEAENAYGDAQMSFLENSLTTSKATWKIVTSSVSFCPIGFDFANSPVPLPSNFPDELRVNLQLNADDWDGFPDARKSLMNLYGSNNAVVISGDIHASFVTTYAGGDGNQVPEFTGPAVSSQTFRDGLLSTVASNPTLSSISNIDLLIGQTDFLAGQAISQSGFSTSLDVRTDAHGYVLMEVAPDRVTTNYRLIPQNEVTNDLTAPNLAPTLASKFETRTFVTTRAGTGLSTRAVPPLFASHNALGEIVLAWPASVTDCSLQASATPDGGGWVSVTNAPVLVSGAKLQAVTLAENPGTRYFRLVCP